ncbi:MAG TPA: threo-3-hydroxy-L-aspartate ammonia-lyase [Mycobacteriales bacterium]|nr:threo-3-hydroxy-L-aspartate ammonia-lyase [Mycobacteriales bacterium]
MVSIEDVRTAAGRLTGVAHRTPVLTSRTLDERTGATVLAKAECFQRVGTFKFRGAYNAIAALDPETRARGVLTYSSGNHAQAIALAAKLHGIPATIVMPHDAPTSKAAATAGYGAELVRYDRYTQHREDLGSDLAAERGRTLIPPYDHADVIAGQGTVALELIEDDGPLDVLVVCVGGGGLIAGCATATAALGNTRVIGVEPEAGDDVRQSLRAGHRVTIPVPRTIADGQQTTSPGELTFPIIQRLVEDVVTVTDEEIVATMVLVFERMKVVLEPSGATALAAVLSGHIPDIAGKRVGVTLSGGNVGADRFAELVSGGSAGG